MRPVEAMVRVPRVPAISTPPCSARGPRAPWCLGQCRPLDTRVHRARLRHIWGRDGPCMRREQPRCLSTETRKTQLHRAVDREANSKQQEEVLGTQGRAGSLGLDSRGQSMRERQAHQALPAGALALWERPARGSKTSLAQDESACHTSGRGPLSRAQKAGSEFNSEKAHSS